MEKAIKKSAERFLQKSKNKKIKIISHYDTDGITSAAILSKTLKKLDKDFSVKIIKNLRKNFLKELNNEELIIFLDLGSSLLEEINQINSDIFILDHHEIKNQPGENTSIINPHLFENRKISASGITYLFCRELIGIEKDLAELAITGLVGDMLGEESNKLIQKIIEDGNINFKKGLLLYPATRPVNKTLEYSSSIYIPGVTGNQKGALKMVQESKIENTNGKFKSIIEMSEEETSNLITNISLRTKKEVSGLIGNIYLIKFFNKQEDAREISSTINACSRLGRSDVALCLCLGNSKARDEAEGIYVDYKRHLVSALNYAQRIKEEKEDYIILNAKDKIKDTIIGTVASIISMSNDEEKGMPIIAMSYDKNKIKVSGRISGRGNKNIKEIIEKAMEGIEGETGGHPQAAGCLIPKEKEQEFIKNLEEATKVETIKV